jgi:hypothetical protein
VQKIYCASDGTEPGRNKRQEGKDSVWSKRIVRAVRERTGRVVEQVYSLLDSSSVMEERPIQ